MCVATPMRLVEARGREGTAELDGVRLEVRLDLVEAAAGDWLLVHAGYAIQVLDETAAFETLALLREVDAAREGS